jgi:hypothetical protein
MDELAKYHPGEEPLVQTTVARRRLKMLLLLKQEVDRLVDGYSSPCLGLFGLFFGAFGSLLITDLTAGITEPIKRYFVDSTVGTGFGSIIFLLFAVREWWRARKVVNDLEIEKGVEVDVAVQAHSGAIERKD